MAYGVTNFYTYIENDGTNVYGVSTGWTQDTNFSYVAKTYVSTNYVLPNVSIDQLYLSSTNWLAKSAATLLREEDDLQYTKASELKQLDNQVIKAIGYSYFDTNATPRYLLAKHWSAWQGFLGTSFTNRAEKTRQVNAALDALKAYHLRNLNVAAGDDYYTNGFANLNFDNMPSSFQTDRYWMDDIYFHTNIVLVP
jgi:hypothetical protein